MVFVNFVVEISTEKWKFQQDFHHFVESDSTLNHFYIHFNTFLKKIKCFSKISRIFSKKFFIWKNRNNSSENMWKNRSLLGENQVTVLWKKFGFDRKAGCRGKIFFSKIAKKVLTNKIKSAIIALA